MANNDFIQVQEIIDKINISFREQINIAEELTSVINGLNSAYKIAPSTYIKAQKDLNVITEQQISSEEKQLRITQELEKANQAQINTLSKELRLRRQREITLDRNAKAAEKELQKLNAAQGLYSRVQQKLNELTKEYRDLAIKKEAYNRLTDEEAKRYTFLQGRITKYDQALKAVDASMGKYGRNVGNYASGFNSLQGSINQLSRELPALGINAQTFFLAISNNLPIFFDAMKETRDEIARLRAEGQEVPGLFNQLQSSILSWGTALSVGVTLLTLFGDDVVEWAGKLFEGTKTLDATKESIKAFNDIQSEASKSIVEEQLQLQAWLKTAQDVTLSYKDREIAADNVLKQYPYWFENLGKEAIMNNQVKEAVEGVNAALLARAKSEAAVGKITENQAKIIDLDEQRLVLVQEQQVAEERLSAIQRRSYAATEQERAYEAETNALKDINNAKKAIASIDKEIATVNEINNRLTSYYISETKKAVGLDYQQEKQKKERIKDDQRLAEINSPEAFRRNIARLEEELSLTNKANGLYGILKLQLDILKDAYEAMYGAQEESNKETEKTIKYGTADYYNDLISKLKAEQSAVSDSSDSYVLYNNIIKSVQDQLDALTGKTKEAAESTKELDDFLKSVSSGALSEIGFSSLNFFTELDQNGQSTFMRLMEQADTFGERAAVIFQGVSSVAEQAFAFINQMSNQSFRIEYDNLEKRYEIAQRFAGDNEAAQEEIRRQYEERRKEIRRRELEAQKEQAVFNAVINTAQGVTAALAQANIPLSVIIAALGAAQIAFIASQQIPAYAEGTMNHPGGMMLVNDAKGSNFKEVIQHPDGRIITPNKRNTLMNAPKGTKVYKSRSEFERQREGFDGALNSILSDAGIGGLGSTINRDRFSGVVVNSGNNGLTKEDVYHAFKAAIAGMPVIRQHWDKDGMVEWHETQTTRTLNKGNQVSFKGIIT